MPPVPRLPESCPGREVAPRRDGGWASVSLLQEPWPLSLLFSWTRLTRSLKALAQSCHPGIERVQLGPAYVSRDSWLLLGVGGPLTPRSLARALEARPSEERHSRVQVGLCAQG